MALQSWSMSYWTRGKSSMKTTPAVGSNNCANNINDFLLPADHGDELAGEDLKETLQSAWQ